MKRLPLTLITACLILGLVGCGGRGADSPTASQQGTMQGVKSPSWLGNPSQDGQFGALGASRKSLGGMGETLKQARMDGRLELARIIGTKVQAAYVRYFEEGGEIYNTETGPEYQTMATELSEDTSRQLTNALLQGSTMREYWEHPQTGEVFVWMVLDPEKRAELERQIKDQAKKQVARRANIAAELKTQEALARLDAAIDAELERELAGM